ncbi:MAG: hypothetical protein ACREJB_03005 [Planctomycetaceae bacterium]
MSLRRRILPAAALLTVLLTVSPAARADDVQLYAAPKPLDVRAQAIQWALGESADANLVQQIELFWPAEETGLSARDVLDKVVGVFALVDTETRQFVAACDPRDERLVPPEPTVLARTDVEPFYLNNMRLFYARYLAQRRMYDEALRHFALLDPATTVDPATCLFFTAVCQQQLMHKEDSLETIDALTKNTEDVPVSYSTLAQLMQYQLESLKEKSLDEVAMLMSDVERRLELARAGKEVQKQEDRVIALLDEIIEKLEQQQSNSGGSGSGNNQSNQSNSPADVSRVKGATAPGNVDDKELGRRGNWGSLPPKEAARVKNLINQRFPSHYRQAVEEYLKKLATKRAEEE